MIGPSLEDISKEMDGKLKVVKVNIDENPQAPSRYSVRSIPTLLLFKNGQVAATKIGAEPKQKLVSWINSSCRQLARVSRCGPAPGPPRIASRRSGLASARAGWREGPPTPRQCRCAGAQSRPDLGGLRAGFLRRVGGMAFDRHGARGAGMARQRPQEAGGVLGRQHAEDQMKRQRRGLAAPIPPPAARARCRNPRCDRHRAIARCPAASPRPGARAISFCRRAGHSTVLRPSARAASSIGTAPRAAARRRRSPWRHCRSGARRPAPAPACRAPRGRFGSGSHRRPARPATRGPGGTAEQRAWPLRRRSPRRSISRWRPITAGTARFRMPAFSAAIPSSLSPRKPVWS